MLFTNYLIISTNRFLQYGQIKKIRVFRATGLKILGKVGTHIFSNIFLLLEINIILFILKGICLSKCIKSYIFSPENLKKSRFHQ